MEQYCLLCGHSCGSNHLRAGAIVTSIGCICDNCAETKGIYPIVDAIVSEPLLPVEATPLTVSELRSVELTARRLALHDCLEDRSLSAHNAICAILKDVFCLVLPMKNAVSTVASTRLSRRLCKVLYNGHRGIESAIVSSELQAILNCSGSDIRRMVNELRNHGVPICSCCGGYFYAVSAVDIEGTVAQLASRLKSIETAKRGLNVFLQQDTF